MVYNFNESIDKIDKRYKNSLIFRFKEGDFLEQELNELTMSISSVRKKLIICNLKNIIYHVQNNNLTERLKSIYFMCITYFDETLNLDLNGNNINKDIVRLIESKIKDSLKVSIIDKGYINPKDCYCYISEVINGVYVKYNKYKTSIDIDPYIANILFSVYVSILKSIDTVE